MSPHLLSLLLAASLAAAPPPARVKTGLEVLIEQDFAPLKGKRVGLITNHTGVTRDYRRTVDVLAKAPGVNLVALFSPEHGLGGDRSDPNVESTTDPATGLPVHSLHDQGRFRPTEEMMRGIDALVYALFRHFSG